MLWFDSALIIFFLFYPLDRASDVSEVSQRAIWNYKTTFDKWPGIVLGEDGEMNKISAEIWFSGGDKVIR